MSPAEASRVFDRFYRGNGHSRDGGSGLGLFIVATLARSLGGEARVDTAPGQGATFEVLLPVYHAGPVRPPGGAVAGGGDKSGATADGGAGAGGGGGAGGSALRRGVHPLRPGQ